MWSQIQRPPGDLCRAKVELSSDFLRWNHTSFWGGGGENKGSGCSFFTPISGSRMVTGTRTGESLPHISPQNSLLSALRRAKASFWRTGDVLVPVKEAHTSGCKSLHNGRTTSVQQGWNILFTSKLFLFHSRHVRCSLAKWELEKLRSTLKRRKQTFILCTKEMREEIIIEQRRKSISFSNVPVQRTVEGKRLQRYTWPIEAVFTANWCRLSSFSADAFVASSIGYT